MIVLAALALAQAAPTYSLEARPGQPTARDMYIACVLFLDGVDLPLDSEGRARLYSARRCDLDALPEMSSRDGREVSNRDMFCLPDTPEIGSDPRRAMAQAYVDHYERIGWGSSFFDGEVAFLTAMINKWPCARSR